MTRRFLFICIVLLVTCGCGRRLDADIKQAFKELDEVLENKHLYDKKKQDDVNSVLRRLSLAETDEERVRCYEILAGKYSHYQCDTSAYYASRAMSLARKTGDRKLINLALMRMAVVQIGNAELTAAKLTLDSIDISRPEEVDMGRYYMYRATVFREMKRFCIFPRHTKMCDDSLRYNIHKFIELADYEDADIYKNNYIAELLRLEGRNEESIEELQKNLENPRMPINTRGGTYYMIARNYSDIGDIPRSELYAAKAAKYHLMTPERAYLSLYRLSQLLYESGDIKRANFYIQRTLDDATLCNYRLRIGQYCESLKTITQAFDQSIRSRARQMAATIAVITVMLLAIIVLMLMIERRRKVIERMKNRYADVNVKLSVSNNQLNEAILNLQDTNVELSEANLIKNEYMRQYMQLCVSYIQQMDSYRMELMKVVKRSSQQEVLTALRSQKMIIETHKRFLSIFDETFLGLFPDFVNQVNKLLVEEARLAPKSKTQLTTELRYMALIRLGVTDSSQIAAFLDSAVSTIYTYRARLRTARINTNLDLEDQVQMINLSQSSTTKIL